MELPRTNAIRVETILEERSLQELLRQQAASGYSMQHQGHDVPEANAAWGVCTPQLYYPWLFGKATVPTHHGFRRANATGSNIGPESNRRPAWHLVLCLKLTSFFFQEVHRLFGSR